MYVCKVLHNTGCIFPMNIGLYEKKLTLSKLFKKIFSRELYNAITYSKIIHTSDLPDVSSSLHWPWSQADSKSS